MEEEEEEEDEKNENEDEDEKDEEEEEDEDEEDEEEQHTDRGKPWRNGMRREEAAQEEDSGEGRWRRKR